MSNDQKPPQVAVKPSYCSVCSAWTTNGPAHVKTVAHMEAMAQAETRERVFQAAHRAAKAVQEEEPNPAREMLARFGA